MPPVQPGAGDGPLRRVVSPLRFLAERTLQETQKYNYPHTLFTQKELELAEHARARLQHLAEHNEWLDAQKKKWATEKHKRDADYRMQHLRDPPPVGVEELEATVLGRVVSSGVADGTNLELRRDPPGGATSSNTAARASRNWRLGQNMNDELRAGDLPGSGQS